MINFLYCIDENYNLQCYLSIKSLIKNSSNNIRVHIIHQKPESFNNYRALLKDKILDLNVHRFNGSSSKFVSLNEHITEASYYRLFFDDYLPEEVEKIVYIDADAFAINSFQKAVDETFIKLSKKNLILAALDVKNYNNNSNFKPYFNAGVLFINRKKWSEENIQQKLESLLSTKEKLEYHDQDLLNICFGDNFLNINEALNVHISLDDNYMKRHKTYLSDFAIFIHYVGKTKPWHRKAMFKLNAVFYHNLIIEFNKGNLEHPPIIFRKRVNFIFKNFLKIFFSRKIIYYVKNIFSLI